MDNLFVWTKLNYRMVYKFVLDLVLFVDEEPMLVYYIF